MFTVQLQKWPAQLRTILNITQPSYSSIYTFSFLFRECRVARLAWGPDLTCRSDNLLIRDHLLCPITSHHRWYSNHWHSQSLEAIDKVSFRINVVLTLFLCYYLIWCSSYKVFRIWIIRCPRLLRWRIRLREERSHLLPSGHRTDPIAWHPHQAVR